MKIDVYADVVCPWCYVGEKRLEKALRQRPDLDVERRWRPFQLRPEMPENGLPWREFAVGKFGGEENMKRAFSHVSAAGEPDGARFDFDRVASAPNTVDAHRLILYAADRGKEWEMADALFRGYFAGGRDLNDAEDLAAMAVETGLDPGEVGAFLSGGVGIEGVWESQQTAARLGITGVPFYVVEGRYAVSGGQPAEVWLRTFDAIQSEFVS
ncbi:disulfide bond formation protein DsbA [Rubrobacter tropicus]|uniref:Disulfide bond formation protein DsbA n=1 Tax=Rubrobacter tropicus TaxID=2653851 RepID=A0A6G8Q6D2_9ACTN|nr:DsbA family oxidoreductase [Rubrobacter tropicus]QIN82016.1 disulfide bond formation protein DsbA [Rubrobacter tropicus]